MKRLEHYFTDQLLKEDFERLCDPELSFDKHRETVNQLVINFVLKYLMVYLECVVKDVRVIRRQLNRLFMNRKQSRKMGGARPANYYDAFHRMSCPGNDDFPLDCAMDLRQTAAVFKEIAFNDRFEKNGMFIGLDVGSGTGILTAAMAVAAKRQRIDKIVCMGIERWGLAVERSRKALKEVLDEREVHIECKNALDENLWRNLSEMRPINYWVSETISQAVSSLDLREAEFGLAEWELEHRKGKEGSDPFVEVLSRSLEVSYFKEAVQQGKLAMFPDIINGLYHPNGFESTLTLKTGSNKPVLLEDVGNEFDDYENLGPEYKRWKSLSEMIKRPLVERLFMSFGRKA